MKDHHCAVRQQHEFFHDETAQPRNESVRSFVKDKCKHRPYEIKGVTECDKRKR